MPGADEIYAAFWEISTNRHLGMGVIGPLPTLAVHDWLDRVQVDDLDDRQAVVRALLAMDKPFMRNANKPLKRQQSARDMLAEPPIEEQLAVSNRMPPLTPKMFDAMFQGAKRRKK